VTRATDENGTPLVDHLASARKAIVGVGTTSEDVVAGKEDIAAFRLDAPITLLFGIGQALIAIAERLPTNGTVQRIEHRIVDEGGAGTSRRIPD
jgi:hypothetical protein